MMGNNDDPVRLVTPFDQFLEISMIKNPNVTEPLVGFILTGFDDLGWPSGEFDTYGYR
jgi:hypothetical protein